MALAEKNRKDEELKCDKLGYDYEWWQDKLESQGWPHSDTHKKVDEEALNEINDRWAKKRKDINALDKEVTNLKHIIEAVEIKIKNEKSNQEKNLC